MSMKQRPWFINSRSWIWLLIGCSLIGFAISTAMSVREHPLRTDLLYVYGAVILTLIAVVGMLLIFFRSGIVSFRRRR